MQNSQLLKQCKQSEYLILCILKMQSWGWRAGSAANRARPALPKDQLIRSQQSRQAAHNHLQLQLQGTTASSAIQGHLACGIHSHIHVDKSYFKCSLIL